MVYVRFFPTGLTLACRGFINVTSALAISGLLLATFRHEALQGRFSLVQRIHMASGTAFFLSDCPVNHHRYVRNQQYLFWLPEEETGW